MRILLDEDESLELVREAQKNGIDPNDLMDMYEQIMTSNFAQDIWDIINENREELGGRDTEKEEYEKQLLFERRK